MKFRYKEMLFHFLHVGQKSKVPTVLPARAGLMLGGCYAICHIRVWGSQAPQRGLGRSPSHKRVFG